MSYTHIAMEGLAAVSLKHLPRYLKAIWVYRVSWHALILKLDEPNFTPVGIIKLSILYKTETWSHPLLASFLYVKHSKLKYNFFYKIKHFFIFLLSTKASEPSKRRFQKEQCELVLWMYPNCLLFCSFLYFQRNLTSLCSVRELSECFLCAVFWLWRR